MIAARKSSIKEFMSPEAHRQFEDRRLLRESLNPESAVLPVAIPGCDFPANALRAYRVCLQRRIASLEKQPNAAMLLQNLLRQATYIDKLRLEHEELYGCGCWYTPEIRIEHQRFYEEQVAK